MGSSDTGDVRNAGTSNLTFQKWATGLLMIVGVEFWLVLGKGDYGTSRQWWPLAIALLVSLVPSIARWITARLDQLRHPSNRTRAWIAVTVAILSTVYFLFSAHEQGRAMRLKYLDEHSYAIGMQMAAEGRLWMPEHPAGDFFEALELIVHPVYASMYFPGTAILFAPSVWLGVPFWIWSAILAGACVGLTYWIVSDLVDSVAGLLCVLILWGSSIFRLVSVMLLSQMPALLMTLLAIFAWLRWRRNHHWKWAMAIGIFGGWCAITRPLDAVALLLPIVIVVAIDSLKKPACVFKTVAAMIGGALPFLIIQLIFNVGVTGSWLTTPFRFSQDRDYPQTALGFHEFDPTIKPASSLPQKLRQYEMFAVTDVKSHQPAMALHSMMYEWLPRLLRSGLPSLLLLTFLPCGMLKASATRAWIPLLSLFLWVALYLLYVFQIEHYIVTLLPLFALAIVCGVEQIRTTWPTMRVSLTTFLTLATVALSLANLPELNRTVHDEIGHWEELTKIDQTLQSITKPAVVLFKYDPSISSEVEPVYNTDVPWPDDAPIVRAHDLGPVRNIEIFRYYARHQPERSFYTYDRLTGSLQYLGLARDLAHAD